jgi:hypothetical protein
MTEAVRTSETSVYIETTRRCASQKDLLLIIAAVKSKSKAVSLHAMEALGERGGIALTHSRPRH